MITGQVKWVDVAKYYASPETRVRWKRGDGEMVECGFPMCDHSFLMGADCKPILRHVADITEAEAGEIFAICNNGKEFLPYYEGHTALDWLERPDYMDGCMMSELRRCVGDPQAWIWLIARGFDLFGLIESFQAIRKEVENV